MCGKSQMGDIILMEQNPYIDAAMGRWQAENGALLFERLEKAAVAAVTKCMV
jgi:hypothetical protein